MKMDITKSPRDIVENRNVKPMQVSSQVAKKASSDGTTNKQGTAVHRQSTRMTVNKLHTDFADIPKPTLSQRPAVAAEEARTVEYCKCAVSVERSRLYDDDRYEIAHGLC